MNKGGNHTWEIIIDYHKCPACGLIIESRQRFNRKSGKWVKELNCSRCNHQFSIEKKPSVPFEMDWD